MKQQIVALNEDYQDLFVCRNRLMDRILFLCTVFVGFMWLKRMKCIIWDTIYLKIIYKWVNINLELSVFDSLLLNVKVRVLNVLLKTFFEGWLTSETKLRDGSIMTRIISCGFNSVYSRTMLCGSPEPWIISSFRWWRWSSTVGETLNVNFSKTVRVPVNRFMHFNSLWELQLNDCKSNIHCNSVYI